MLLPSEVIYCYPTRASALYDPSKFGGGGKVTKLKRVFTRALNQLGPVFLMTRLAVETGSRSGFAAGSVAACSPFSRLV